MSGADSAGALLHAAARRLEHAGIAADEARAEARLLLCHSLGIGQETLRAHPDCPVSPEAAVRFDALIARRAAREPLAYITGARAFYGLALAVTPAVLIPRPETEFLVETALRHLAGRAAPRVADIGTGSGAIAVAVAVNAPDARVWASDVSEDALMVARRNAEQNGVADRITFAAGDALTPLRPFAPFDALLSNPPYIAASDIDALMPEVRDWEPRLALGIRDDALFFYRRFAAEAPPLLAPGGLLAVEVGQGQAEAVAHLWSHEAGLAEVKVVADYAGIGRVVAGRKR